MDVGVCRHIFQRYDIRKCTNYINKLQYLYAVKRKNTKKIVVNHVNKKPLIDGILFEVSSIEESNNAI